MTMRAPRPAPPQRTTAARPDKAAAQRPAAHAAMHVVGIGASAGGLEALEQFFGMVPVDSGLAYVVVQHLDPKHSGMLPELLQRATRLKVMQAEDRMPLAPDCVYVIPPNKDLSLLHGVLHLLDPPGTRGPHLPIDSFLRALAEDQHERAIAVILSGMGSDGTLGLRDIKAAAGLALAQDPATAKFDSMPRHAIAAGIVDIVAPADELPRRILETLRHASASLAGAELEGPARDGNLDKIIILLRGRSGQDFSLYKKTTLYRRIERRMHLHQFDAIAEYAHYLGQNSQELDLLFKELLIGVTSFFRDPAAWSCLREQALPSLLADCADGTILRAWVVACSTGEEAYSLAMSLREALDDARRSGRVGLQIFATDLDSDAIDKARQGFYPPNIAADVSPERLARFFIEEPGGYRVRKDIREMVVFAPHNVAVDPPFTRIDMLTCRNLLIYIGPELQAKLLPLFHYSLNPGGILFLGSAETVGRYTDLFPPIDSKARLFRRSGATLRAHEVDFQNRHLPAAAGTPGASPAQPVANLQTIADQLLLQRFAPASVLVNAAGDILYIHGRTGKYLEPAAGKANWNIYAMARDDLRHALMVGLPRALRDGEAVSQTGARVNGDGGSHHVDVTMQRIDEPQALRGMAMIVFTDAPEPPPRPAPAEAAAAAAAGAGVERVAEMETALRRAHEELQAVREEMQSREEELRSANEEFQSTNEELQSTNEELTTSKEEMQSLNEELQTLNAELQSKVDELLLASNDMKNLLNSTDMATIFLDGNLKVRRFTTQVNRMFKLIPGDVGRPLSDIATDLDYPALQDDAREVLRTLVFSEKQIPTPDGRWFQAKIMPYRTTDNVIDGVVITFTDITAAKKLEAALRTEADRHGDGR